MMSRSNSESRSSVSNSKPDSMQKALVLLSAGLDSTVNLFAAMKKYKVAMALTFDYGQRASAKEVTRSKALAEFLHVPHQVVSLPWFSLFGKSSLLQTDQQVPGRRDVSIDDLQASTASAKSVWVPNRNGILLNIAAGFAESQDIDFVIPGFNKEEAVTFPDNTTDFMRALDRSFSYSTSNHVRVDCLTDLMDKTEIVELGKALNVPFELMWPCYHSFKKWCGECESCQRSRRALIAAGVETKGLFLDEN